MKAGTRAMAAVLVVATGMLATVLAGCSNNDSTTSAPEPITVDVYFDVNISGQPISPLNSLIFTNDAGTKYSVKTLRFVLTDVYLHAVDGKKIKLADLHYYTIDDPSTQKIHVSAGVPHDDWDRLTFVFGLDETKNVRDKYINSNPKFHQEMAWPTGMGASLGYHYMQLEGNYEETAGGATAGYTTHTGAHQLAGDPVPLHYYFPVDLPMTATHVHEGGTGEVTIHFDFNGWYKDHTPADGTDTSYDWHDLEGTPMGQMIMGNPAAQEKLQANGPFCFSASMVAVGGHH
jgi:hypothetical protein